MRVKPDTVTVMLLPTAELANVPTAPVVTRVATSGLITPVTPAPVVTSVAVVVPSNVLLLAVIPVTVSVFAVTVSFRVLVLVLPLKLAPGT